MHVTSPVVVGRDAELRLLDTHLAAARGGVGNAVLVIGEAGIGKSRLIADCASQAFVSGMPVLRGRASASGVLMPFRPFTEALLSHFRSAGPPTDPDLVPYRPALARLVPEWGSKAGAGAEPLVVLAEAVLRLLTVVGRGQGCLIVLEDLHDADAETLAVVEYLIDNLAGQPVLLVASLRPEPGPAVDLARIVGQRRAAPLLDLGPLNPDEVRRLAGYCLDVVPGTIPQQVVERLVHDAEGNPFIAEEMLRDALTEGNLTCQDGVCRIEGTLSGEVPRNLVATVAARANRLGVEVRALLDIAAVLGRTFSVSAVQVVAQLDDRTLLSHLTAAADARLIGPDGASPDRYAFRPALTADALLASLAPAQRAAIARRAADALVVRFPGLSGDWCALVARLRLTAGEDVDAGRLFAEAGRRAFTEGAIASAIVLLDRSHELLAAGAADERSLVLESLVEALAEAGQLDRAFELAAALPPAGVGAPGTDRRTALHTRLAWGSVVAGRWDDAAAQVGAARSLLGRPAPPHATASVDVVEAHLMLEGRGRSQGRGPDRTAAAEHLAARAVRVAERLPLPVAACQAWQLLALLARQRSFDEADACLARMLAVAETHELQVWRVNATLRLGIHESMRSGDTSGLERALRAAEAIGAIALAYAAEGSIALEAVLQGDYQAADELTARCVTATARLRYVDDHQYALLTRATLAAHQGDRRGMEDELAEFRRWGGEQSLQMPVLLGLCRTFCALLEEDRELALAELDRARAWEEGNPTVFYLAGRYGLRPLLDVLGRRWGWPEYKKVLAAPGAVLRWNRQFLLLAEAVLLGRDGRGEEAAAAVTAAQKAAACYPLAHHLGLRLVAEAAIEDGWGSPTQWLRHAEAHFHVAGLPIVAGACRTLLRRCGTTAPQRRVGRDLVPDVLLSHGLTVREYEVLVLLMDRHGNKEIAQRLFISPRTVEKHVASLVLKTGRANRASLREYAVETLGRAYGAGR